jgi:hypothetical protein
MRGATALVALALLTSLCGVGALVSSTTPAGADGSAAADVVSYGFASDLGAPAGPLNGSVLGIEAHPTQHGYWILARDGGVFTYGAARFYGSTGGMRLNRPVVSMAADRSVDGYWLVAVDGGVFTFGAARFYGSTGSIALNEPIVGMAPLPDGRGYWLVAADGGVFSFGAARFHGSLGGTPIVSSVVAITATPTGGGYWLATSDGGVFAYGDARYLGGVTGAGAAPIVDMTATGSGHGYWLLGNDGTVHPFGDAVAAGGAPVAGRDAVGIARTPESAGYWVVNVPALPPAPPNSGTGRRIVYSNSQQRVWLVEDSNGVSHSWLVSGRRGMPAPGTYHVYSKAVSSTSGTLTLPYTVRFAWGTTLPIAFHGIPLRPDGTPIQTDAELGQYRSHGCVRMAQAAAHTLYDWAPIGTTVVVLP